MTSYVCFFDIPKSSFGEHKRLITLGPIDVKESFEKSNRKMSCPYHFENKHFHRGLAVFESLRTLLFQPNLDFAFSANRHHPNARKHFHTNGIIFSGHLKLHRRPGTATRHSVIIRLSNATPVGLTPSIALKIMPHVRSNAKPYNSEIHDLLLLSDVPTNRRTTFFHTGFSSMVLNDVYYNHNRLDAMTKFLEEIDPVNLILAKTHRHTRALSVSHFLPDTFAVYVHPTQYPPIQDLSDFVPTRMYSMKFDVYRITIRNTKQRMSKVGVVTVPLQTPTIDDGTTALYFRHRAFEKHFDALHAKYMSHCMIGTRYWGSQINSRFKADVEFVTRPPIESSECSKYNAFVLQTTTNIYERNRDGHCDEQNGRTFSHQ